MPTTVDIKKGNGIEGLLRGFAAGKPEEVKLIEVATNTDIETLLGRYKAFLGVGDIIHNIGDEEVNKISTLFTEVLKPELITALTILTEKYAKHKNYTLMTGFFITRLIQNSYNAGHNGFTIIPSETTATRALGATLVGEETRPIEISIVGDIDEALGIASVNCKYKIQGNVGHQCGADSNNCEYNIQGDVGDSCGYEAKNSIFNIQGDVGHNCGEYAKKCEFSIQGKVADFGSYARNLTFKTSNPATLQDMLDKVPITEKSLGITYQTGHRIIFIKSDGTEKIVRDHGNNS